MPCAPCWPAGPNLCTKARHAPMMRTEQTARKCRMATKLKNQEQAGQPASSFLPRLQGQRAAPSCLDAAPPSTGEPACHFYASQVSRQPYLPIFHAPPVSKLFRPCSVKITEAQDLRQFCMEAKTAFSAARSKTSAPHAQAGKYDQDGHSRYLLIFFSISGTAYSPPRRIHQFARILQIFECPSCLRHVLPPTTCMTAGGSPRFAHARTRNGTSFL